MMTSGDPKIIDDLPVHFSLIEESRRGTIRPINLCCRISTINNNDFTRYVFYLEFSIKTRYFRITCEASNATQLRSWNHCGKVVRLKFLMLQWLHSGLTFFCPSVSEHHVRWGFRHIKLFWKCFQKKSWMAIHILGIFCPLSKIWVEEFTKITLL